MSPEEQKFIITTSFEVKNAQQAVQQVKDAIGQIQKEAQKGIGISPQVQQALQTPGFARTAEQRTLLRSLPLPTDPYAIQTQYGYRSKVTGQFVSPPKYLPYQEQKFLPPYGQWAWPALPAPQPPPGELFAHATGGQLAGAPFYVPEQKKRITPPRILAKEIQLGTGDILAANAKEQAARAAEATSKYTKLNEQYKLGVIGTQAYNRALYKLNETFGTHYKLVETAGINIGKLILRAATIIPIWMVLRNAMMAVIGSVQEGIRNFIEFDKALARVKSVLVGVTDIRGFMSGIAGEIRRLVTETGVSASQAAEAFYRFSSAGLNAKVALAGMNTSVKLSVALMGDSTETARTLADLYVLLGDRITSVKTEQEKMNYIASSIALLWKANTFELNEFTEGLKTFAATATTMNLTVDQMIALLAATHTLMQRGSSGGTQLSRAFIDLAQNTKAIGNYLNADADALIKANGYFNVFTMVVEKLNRELKTGIPVMKEIETIFDVRASKAVAGFVEKFDLVLTQLKTVDLPFIEKMKVLNELFLTQYETIDRQIKIFGQLKNQLGEAFLLGITNAEDLEGALEKINNYIKTNLIPTFMYVGTAARKFFELFTENEKEQEKEVLEKFARSQPGILTTRRQLRLIQEKEKRNFLESLKKATIEEKIDILKGIGFDETKAEKFARKMSEISEETMYDMINFYGKVKERTVEQEKKEKAIADLKKQQVEQEAAINNTLQYKLLMIEKLSLLGYSEIAIEKIKYQELSNQEEKRQQLLKIVQMEIEEQKKYANILKTSFSEAIEGLLKAETTLTGAFQKIGDTIRDTIIKGVSEGLTAQIFKATGIGEMFASLGINIKRFFSGEGGVVGAIKGSFEYGAELTEKAIISGFEKATGKKLTFVSPYGKSRGYQVGNVVDQFGNIISSGGGGGGGWGFPGFGQGGWFGQQAIGGGYQMLPDPWTGRLVKTPVGRNIGMTKGQGVGLGFQSALTGYSAYQSARAGGISQGQAIGSGILTGAGSLLMGIALANAWNPLGWTIAIGTTIAGILTGSLGGRKSTQTSIQTQVAENRISSKIDVTNKQLEIVNRNLVALKSTMETYILPQSAFFAEKRNLEDNFALSSRRGLTI